MSTDDTKQRKRKSLEERLDEAKKKAAQLQAQLAAKKARQNQLTQKQLTHKKILVGAAIMETWDEDKIQDLMAGFLKREADRKLFGLDPLEDSDPANTPPTQDGGNAPDA